LAETGRERSIDLLAQILTLKSSDGFTVSFAASDDQFRSSCDLDVQPAGMQRRLSN